jgi:hypothetical protein
MPLFDQIMGAIANPNQQASTDQLGSILSAVQQLSSNQGMSGDQTQTMISVVGSYVRSSLQQERSSHGEAGVQSLLNQFAGTQPNPNAPNALFSPAQQQQIAQTVSQRTGLDPAMVQSLLPMVVPVILNLLNTGSSTGASPQPGAAAAQGSGNSVLNAFLDADGDGDVDMADTLSMAGRFLS